MRKSLKSTLAVMFLALVALGGCKGSGPASGPASGSPAPQAQTESRRRPASTTNFDYYLLNLSWSPEFCHSHPTAPECAAHPAFVLHGLWPENTDGSYPENCSSAPGPSNPSQYSDIFPDPGLLAHEWHTHGTCSGLDPDAYFQSARTAFHSIAIPPALSGLTQQASMTPDQIVGLFRGSNASIPQSSFAVSCGHNYLTAVEVCLDKSLHPAACTGIKSCGATTVKIPAP